MNLYCQLFLTMFLSVLASWKILTQCFVHRSQLWVESTGRKDLIGVTPVYLSENVRICSEHFESYFYHPGSCRLRAGAVPTLFGESAGRRSQRAAFIHLLTLREEQTPKRPELGEHCALQQICFCVTTHSSSFVLLDII